MSECEVFLSQANAFLGGLKDMRRECFLDRQRCELRAGDDLADALHSLISASNSQYTRELAEELMND